MVKSKLLAAVMLCALDSSMVMAQDTEGQQVAGAGARVRFFGQAAIGIKLFKNQSCYAGRGIQASKKGPFGGKNVSIGMPNSPNVDNMKSRDGILFAATYHEYAVRAGQPLTIHVDYSETTGSVRLTTGNMITETEGISNSCEKFAEVFTPEAGQDYDVTVDIGRGTCQLHVQKIESKDSAVRLQPVATAKAPKCASDVVLPIAACKATYAECKADVLEKFKETNASGKPDKAAFAECTAEYKACAAETR